MRTVHFLLHYAHESNWTDRSAWQAYNASIVGLPAEFQFPGNWNPAPVALPDGRVRIMVHTGWSGKTRDIEGWSGEVIVEADSWRGPYRMISSRDITNCIRCEEGWSGVCVRAVPLAPSPDRSPQPLRLKPLSS